MDVLHTLMLFAGGLLAGIINVTAGGAGFLTFPLLIASGLTGMQASASNSVALFPAYIVGGWVYRREIQEAQNHIWLRVWISAIGSAIGTALFVWLGEASFHAAIPWLLVFATLSFLAGPLVRRWLQSTDNHAGPFWFYLSLTLEFATYVYGGYFGLGMGIILLAIHSIFSPMSVHHANALRTVTIAVSSVIGIAINSWSGLVHWLPAFAMMTGTVISGYGMASFARNLPASVVRGAIIIWSVMLTCWSFWHYGT